MSPREPVPAMRFYRRVVEPVPDVKRVGRHTAVGVRASIPIAGLAVWVLAAHCRAYRVDVAIAVVQEVLAVIKVAAAGWLHGYQHLRECAPVFYLALSAL